MTETKTFKNVAWVGSDGHADEWIVSDSLPSRFPTDEYDMEVIFTKKEVNPEVGGTCRLRLIYDPDGVTYTIIAVSDDLVWIRNMNETYEDNTGWIESISSLTDVKPWQPA